MIADATGHGLPSALMTAAARGFFSLIEKLIKNDYKVFESPSLALSYGNQVIFDASGGKILMSAFAAVLDTKKMEMTFANAGHNHPVFLRKNSEGNYEAAFLSSSGELLGLNQETTLAEELTMELEKDDILFLYTDGITECGAQTNNMYGKKRLKKCLLDNAHLSSHEIVQNVAENMQNFMAGREFEDDVTFVAVCLNPKEPK
jgi:sigma-B regulation protein RsbU (phosphoserine phosphatase)